MHNFVVVVKMFCNKSKLLRLEVNFLKLFRLTERGETTRKFSYSNANDKRSLL